jgi:hypothetical protein
MLLSIRSRQATKQPLAYTEVCLKSHDYALAIRRELAIWAKADQA